MAAQPTRAFLHEVVTSATSPYGTLYVVGYVFDADHDRHLVFATGANFEDPSILTLMKGQEIRLTSGSPCLEVLPSVSRVRTFSIKWLSNSPSSRSSPRPVQLADPGIVGRSDGAPGRWSPPLPVTTAGRETLRSSRGGTSG
jgi:hypothetical protein